MTFIQYPQIQHGGRSDLAAAEVGSSASRSKARRSAPRRRSAARRRRSLGVQPRLLAFGWHVSSSGDNRSATLSGAHHAENPFRKNAPSITASPCLRLAAEARMTFKPARFRACWLVQLRAPCGVEARL